MTYYLGEFQHYNAIKAIRELMTSAYSQLGPGYWKDSINAHWTVQINNFIIEINLHNFFVILSFSVLYAIIF